MTASLSTDPNNDPDLLTDLDDYAQAFEGRRGTSGYAICARNAAKRIRELEDYVRYVESRIERREFPPTLADYQIMCRGMERTNGD